MAAASRVPAVMSSDEEQAIPLMSQRQAGSARFGLCAGLLLVSVGVVGKLMYGRGGFNAQPNRQVMRLSSTMQAFAAQQVGRPLTGSEVEAIYSHVHKSSRSRARALLASRSPKDCAQDLPVNLSDACIDAVHDKLKQVVEAFAQLLIEAFFGCVVSDEESKECSAATTEMALFMDHMVTKCQADGDFCNITMAGLSEGKKVDDYLGTCVPALCHGEAREAIEYFQTQLDEEMQEAKAQADANQRLETKDSANADDCSNCTIGIECPTAGKSGEMEDATQLKDAQHVSV